MIARLKIFNLAINFKMKKEQLEIYSSELESEIFKIAYDEIKFRSIYDILVVFQSHCNFNLFWVYSIAPEVVLHIKTIEFLNDNSNHFKRKLSIKELLNYDLVINIKEPENFSEFKGLKCLSKLK